MSAWMDLLQKIGFKKSARGQSYPILLFILSASFFYFINGSSSNGYIVTEVIDGDTIVIEGSDNHVRYLDIDAPEILHEDSPGDPLGKEATNLNKSLVLGKKAKLEFDKGKFDAYGRDLAYVYADGIFVNQELVRNGLARTLIIKPNGKYANIIYEAENEAKRERRCIWGDLDKLNPPSENLSFLIKPSQASRNIDQRAVVRGKITNFRKSDKVVALKLEDELDIVIFPDDWGNFRFFGINPESYYLGKPVEVIGKVRMYKGRPEIRIGHPISIRTLG
jgi:endonuclease YncB( thermonuclease family)